MRARVVSRQKPPGDCALSLPARATLLAAAPSSLCKRRARRVRLLCSGCHCAVYVYIYIRTPHDVGIGERAGVTARGGGFFSFVKGENFRGGKVQSSLDSGATGSLMIPIGRDDFLSSSEGSYFRDESDSVVILIKRELLFRSKSPSSLFSGKFELFSGKG